MTGDGSRRVVIGGRGDRPVAPTVAVLSDSSVAVLQILRSLRSLRMTGAAVILTALTQALVMAHKTRT